MYTGRVKFRIAFIVAIVIAFSFFAIGFAGKLNEDIPDSFREKVVAFVSDSDIQTYPEIPQDADGHYIIETDNGIVTNNDLHILVFDSAPVRYEYEPEMNDAIISFQVSAFNGKPGINAYFGTMVRRLFPGEKKESIVLLGAVVLGCRREVIDDVDCYTLLIKENGYIDVGDFTFAD